LRNIIKTWAGLGFVLASNRYLIWTILSGKVVEHLTHPPASSKYLFKAKLGFLQGPFTLQSARGHPRRQSSNHTQKEETAPGTKPQQATVNRQSPINDYRMHTSL